MTVFISCYRLGRIPVICTKYTGLRHELHYFNTAIESTISQSDSGRETLQPRGQGVELKILQETSIPKYRCVHSTSGNFDKRPDEPLREIPVEINQKQRNVSSTDVPTDGEKLDSKESGDNGDSIQEQAYETHIPTNLIQRGILSFGAAMTALLDPHRHDMVAVLGETTGYQALSKIYTMMVQDSEGQQVLMDKPRINSSTVDMSYLSKLPEDTLGYLYIKFLNDNNVTPDSRLPVQFIDDPELAYVMQRYREGHDLFHTVLGMPTNMLGEVAVKWVEAIQTDLPMCYGAAMFGPLRFRPKQRQKYLSLYLPWALRVGRSSKLLMNMYFEKRWEQPLQEIRNEFSIEPFPTST